MASAVTVAALEATAAERRVGELAAVLVDSVAHGASVNFLAGLTADDAAGFWRGQLQALQSGEKQLFVAETSGTIVGTVVLALAQQPNGRHRGEIGKMLVLSGMRRRGLGRRLLEVAEAAARKAGRTMLMLDTEAGSGGEQLYRRCGWTAFGTMPDHARRPDGVLAPTTFFYKRLG